MNKQELIEYCESLKGDLNKFINGIDVDKIIAKIKQLDEPQKPVVPQFVVDWIEKCKAFVQFPISISFALNPRVWEENRLSNESIEWLMSSENQETFARAWLDGYTVEEEKRYLVKVKGLEKKKCYLNYNFGGVWLIYNQDNFGGYRAHHTRKELEEAGFGEVFNSPLFEVEEVEE